MRGEPMTGPVTLPIGTALPPVQHLPGGENCDHQPLPPLPLPSGSCGALHRRAIDTGIFRTRTASMADYELEALSLGELKKMQKDVAKAISTFEDRQKAEARAKVEALARDLGYSLAELVGTETKASRAPVAAKYRHPENPALTWSGRGRKPQWFVEALEAGKTAGDLEIG